MKQWIKSVLYIPKHQKPTDENILVGIVICMICLAGSTWAWFTANVQTKPQAIAAANYEIEVTIDGGPVAAPISLQVGQIYKITLTAGGTAAKFGGYCKVEGDGKPRRNADLYPDSRQRRNIYFHCRVGQVFRRGGYIQRGYGRAGACRRRNTAIPCQVRQGSFRSGAGPVGTRACCSNRERRAYGGERIYTSRDIRRLNWGRLYSEIKDKPGGCGRPPGFVGSA